MKTTYYQLLSKKLKNELEKTIKLKILLQNYDVEIYILQLTQIDNAFDSDFQLLTPTSTALKMLKNIFSPQAVFGKHMQEDINLLVTDGKLNKCEFWARA